MLELDAATIRAVDTHEPVGEHLGCGSRRVEDAPQARWAVAQTHPQAERWALANLSRQSFDAYLPLMAVRRRDNAIRSLWHTVEVPLFNGYIFVGITSPFWAPIQHTRGISRLLMAGDHPHYLAPGVLEAIQATQDVRRRPLAAKPFWAPGVPCSLATGAMHGLPAVVLNAEGDDVRIGVMFLGQIRQISVAPECLKPRDCLN